MAVGNRRGAAVDVQVVEMVSLRDRPDLVVQNRDEVLVEDLLLLVRDDQEALVGLIQFLLRQGKAQLLQTIAKTVASGTRGQHYATFGEADIFGKHDFVSLAILQKAIDVDSRTVGKRIASDDRLVRRNRDSEHVRDQATGAQKLARIKAGVEAI